MFSALVRSIFFVACIVGAVCAQETSAIWLDVPFEKQVKEGCGSASIAMVMQYWYDQQGRSLDDSARADTIHRALFEPAAEGIYASAMESYFRDQKFRTFSFRGDWDLLGQHLRNGRPLIVALKPPGSDSSLHYVVVVGLDLENDLVLLNDPARRKLIKENRSDFEKQWSATGEWTLLALPQPTGS